MLNLFSLLVHPFLSLSCLSCPCFSDKVQGRVQVGQVSGVLWHQLATLKMTIPATYSNPRSKASHNGSQTKLDHWRRSKTLATHPRLLMVSAALTLGLVSLASSQHDPSASVPFRGA